MTTSARLCLLLLAGVLLPLATAAAGPKPSPTPAALASDVQDIVICTPARPVLLRLHVRLDGRPFRASWEDFMGRLFRHLDADGDGFLGKKEAQHVPAAQGLRQLMQAGGFNIGGSPGPTVAFTELDTDPADGKVSPAELMAYYRQNGAGPFLGPLLTLNASSAAATDALFARLDRDGDGKLSKEELEGAEEALRSFDLNGDELIGAREVVPDSASPFFAAPPQPVNVSAAPPEFNFIARTDGKDADKRMGEMILRHYQRDKSKVATMARDYLKVLDTPQPGKPPGLTSAQVALDKETFDRLDLNKDGKLDASELARICDGPADVELAIDLNRAAKESAADLTPAGKSGPRAATVDRLGDNAFRLTLGEAQVALDAGSQASGYGDLLKSRRDSVREFYKQQFQAADANKDGFVDEKEMKQPPGQFLRGLFPAADRNGDGKLSEQEVLAYLDLLFQVPAAITTLAVSADGRGLFELLDANRDGFLSRRELRTAWARLRPWDRDGDGRITREELPHQFRLTLSGGEEGYARRQLPFGFDRGSAPRAGYRGPLWFRKMDRNGDGDVSEREFLGSREDFRRIDRDGDGLIDASEAEEADGWFRKQAGSPTPASPSGDE